MRLYPIFFISLFLPLLTFSQSNTITVTGTHEVFLSPNEILIGIDYQEYFYEEAGKEIKVPIETLEQDVLAAIYAGGVSEDKITIGGARIIRPYVNRVYQKRRIQKSLMVCVGTTEEFLDLTRSFEESGLFEKVVVGFDIKQLRHTERDDYETLCRSKAFANAREKAVLILEGSGQTAGMALTVKELQVARGGRGATFNPETYEAVVSEGADASGFAAIKVSYAVEVVFELQ